jgi:hypothetical protein
LRGALKDHVDDHAEALVFTGDKGGVRPGNSGRAVKWAAS